MGIHDFNFFRALMYFFGIRLHLYISEIFYKPATLDSYWSRWPRRSTVRLHLVSLKRGQRLCL